MVAQPFFLCLCLSVCGKGGFTLETTQISKTQMGSNRLTVVIPQITSHSDMSDWTVRALSGKDKSWISHEEPFLLWAKL